MKRAFVIFLAGVLSVGPAPVYAFDALALETLLEEARSNNPDIRAARKRWEAAAARVPLARALDDPVIGFTFEKVPRATLKLDKSGPDERMLSFSQFLPFFGKLSLKGKIALVESQMIAAEYKDKELQVCYEIKNAYFELFLNDKEARLQQESLKLLESLAKIAETDYSVGDTTQAQVYKLHAEIAELQTGLLNLAEENKVRRARLNTLLNRDPEGALGQSDLKEDIDFKADLPSLYQSALDNQPELRIFSYAIERNEHAKTLAKKSYFSDVMASVVQRGITSGSIGPWDLMLSFTVPLWFWTKQRYEVKSAIASVEEAQAAYQAMQNKVSLEIREVVSRIEIAKNKVVSIQNSLIPILEGSLESSLAAFRSGKGDFMILLDSQRTLVEARRTYYRELVEYYSNLAELERVVGVRIR